MAKRGAIAALEPQLRRSSAVSSRWLAPISSRPAAGQRPFGRTRGARRSGRGRRRTRWSSDARKTKRSPPEPVFPWASGSMPAASVALVPGRKAPARAPRPSRAFLLSHRGLAFERAHVHGRCKRAGGASRLRRWKELARSGQVVGIGISIPCCRSRHETGSIDPFEAAQQGTKKGVVFDATRQVGGCGDVGVRVGVAGAADRRCRARRQLPSPRTTVARFCRGQRGSAASGTRALLRSSALRAKPAA